MKESMNTFNQFPGIPKSNPNFFIASPLMVHIEKPVDDKNRISAPVWPTTTNDVQNPDLARRITANNQSKRY